jgi:hypothetical protein
LRSSLAKIHKFFLLSSDEKKFLTKAFFLLAVFRFALIFVSLPNFEKMLPKRRLFSHPSKSLLISQIIWAVNVAGRNVPSSCLSQALTARFLLHRCGIDAKLQIGVSKNPSEPLEAHAWIECENKIYLGGPAINTFTPLFSKIPA